MSIQRIFLRQDSSTSWVSNNPVLSAGELGYDTTNNYLKCGDGTTPWNTLGQLYDIAGITANATAISAHSTRLTNLETYSPLGSGTGTVTGITWRNLTELALAGEKITNGTLNSTGGVTAWSPTDLSSLETWLDASDSSTITHSNNKVSLWEDKSGNNRDVSQAGADSIKPTFSSNSLAFDGSQYLFNNSPFMYANGSIEIFIVASGNSQNDTRLLNEGSSTNNTPLYGFKFTNSVPLGRLSVYFRNSSYGVMSAHTLTSISALDGTDRILHWKDTGTTIGASMDGDTLSTHNYSTARSGTLPFNRFCVGGILRAGFSFGFVGDVKEIIVSPPNSNSDRQKIEGYLAHKWGTTSNLPSNHPYQSNAPTISTLLTQGWSVQSGSWGSTNQANGVLSGAVTIRQNVNLGSGGVYDVTLDRTDSNSSLTSKVKTSHAVTWLSHSNAVASEADVAHDGTARFEVTGTVPTYIELDTVDSDRTLTFVSMTQSVLAGGTVQAGNNGTLEKIAGADAWNAGASSTEYIGGQNEGYVQFQIAQTGKDLKTGLTYADVDYGNADPFEMTFSGTDVSIGGSVRTTYASADFFRIRHDSANNQIQYQKRQTTSNGLEYVTFYTDPTTTNGSNLYFDTSFYHLNGRINDVTMVV